MDIADTIEGLAPRSSIAIGLPPGEREVIGAAFTELGFSTYLIDGPRDLPQLAAMDVPIAAAILDVADDPESAAAVLAELTRRGTPVPVLYVTTNDGLDALEAAGIRDGDELLLRPLAFETLRWRVEAMAIRAQVPSGASSDTVLTSGHVDGGWAPAVPVFAVFNPKGGVGKTTIATNLAAVLQLRKHMNVLLLDADTVTGHVGLSLGMPTGRSAADSWVDEDAGYQHESLLELSAEHSSGIRVASLSTNPLSHATLAPARVADAIMEARHGVDAIVIDLHPSYSEVNLAVFAIADRILVPVTPDLPAMRAAIQLKEVAVEIGVRDRLAMIINRANSGVTVADMETTVGMKAIAHIRSAGLHFVWSANAGKSLIDKFPKHPATQDFEQLADRLLSTHAGTPTSEQPRETSSLLKNLFGRKAISEA